MKYADTAMLQKPIDDTDRLNGPRARSANRRQTADASKDQMNLDARVSCFTQLLNHRRVFQVVQFQDDECALSGLRILDLVVEHSREPLAHIKWSNQEMIESPRVARRGQIIEELAHLVCYSG